MQPGTILSDKYRLHSMLGRGGMGSVWRAEHLGLEAPVAVKLMDPSLAQTLDGLERFHREAHAAATIRSPHVVQVLDHGLDEPTNTPYIVMELLEGETLGERLARERTLSLARTTALVIDLCRALTRAHRAGIVHRDLKPDNIFLVHDEREFPKLLDFGVAKSRPLELGASGGTRPGSMVGTPCYMSPEQISGATRVDGRSDLWALAVIAYECITGRRLFEADTLGALVLAICTEPVSPSLALVAVPDAFRDWFVRALARDPARRFQTAREFGEALHGACIASGAARLEPHWVSLEPLPTPPPESEESEAASEPLLLLPRVMQSPPLPVSAQSGTDALARARPNTLDAQTTVLRARRRATAPMLAVLGALALLSGGLIWVGVEDRVVATPIHRSGPVTGGPVIGGPVTGGPVTGGPVTSGPVIGSPALVTAGASVTPPSGSTHTAAGAPVLANRQEPAVEPRAETMSLTPSPASVPARRAAPAARANGKRAAKPRPATRGTTLEDALEGDRGRSNK